MYNRYIPQSDGTHHRRPVNQQAPPVKPAPTPQPEHVPESPPPFQKEPVSGSVPGFLRSLLPKEFDTGDLLVLLLLLLMAGDGKEDKNTALLTLALYFFL